MEPVTAAENSIVIAVAEVPIIPNPQKCVGAASWMPKAAAVGNEIAYCQIIVPAPVAPSRTFNKTLAAVTAAAESALKPIQSMT